MEAGDEWITGLDDTAAPRDRAGRSIADDGGTDADFRLVRADGFTLASTKKPIFDEVIGVAICPIGAPLVVQTLERAVSAVA